MNRFLRLLNRYLLPVLACLATGLAAAALTVALRGYPMHPHQYGHWQQQHQELCALLGAIMDDNDSSAGLFGRVAALYAEDRCDYRGP